MIKGIFFDAAGILYQRAGHTMDFAFSLLRNEGFFRDATEVSMTHLQTLRTQANQGLVNHETYWDQFLLVHGVTEQELRQDYITRIIEYSNDVLPVPGARKALEGLKQRNFLLGIVTDTMYPLEWKRRRLKKVGVDEFIDVIACSTVLGVHKPDSRMYLNALQQANLSPEESAFVGHLAIELRGAREAGMLTVAINFEPDAVADYYCKSILDLLRVPVFHGVPGKENNGALKGQSYER
jgi:HAD superfamily hydrolase (TIGR01509 family)